MAKTKTTPTDPAAVHIALGITDEWRESLADSLGSKMTNTNNPLIADIILSVGKEIKEQEFDVHINELTDYEKKLLYAGMQFGKGISDMANMNMMISMFGGLFDDKDKTE